MVFPQVRQSRSDLLERSITKALAFLVSCQQEDGGFPVIRWHPSGASFSDDTLFGTACILLAMGELLPSLCRRAALALLRRRRDAKGFWHFDIAGHLPADADDTACNLAALLRFAPLSERPTPSDFERLASFVRPNGRITTWLTQARLANPDTDDVVVVANVIYAMGLYDVSRAELWLSRWLMLNTPGSGAGSTPDGSRNSASRMSSGIISPTSRYYLHIETVYYAWARLLRTLELPLPSVPITDTTLNSPLCCALALSTVDDPNDDLVPFLLASQHPSGFWAEEPWFRSPGACFGSAALTTAFAVEALKRWQRAKGKGKK